MVKSYTDKNTLEGDFLQVKKGKIAICIGEPGI